MPSSYNHSLLHILNSNGGVVGAGFVVDERLAVTCAHVVRDAGSVPGGSIQIECFHGNARLLGQVLATGYSPVELDDVAFVQVDAWPDGIVPVVLGAAEGRIDHRFTALGFPAFGDYAARSASGYLGAVIPVVTSGRQPLLQLDGDAIARGLSGGPVLDLNTQRVAGMITEFKDDTRLRFAYATTAEALQALQPTLRLWPDAYGPTELAAYLDHLANTYGLLDLPVGGGQVPLERLYISLRADAMNAAERQAEHDVYQADVEALQQLAGLPAADHYLQFAAMRKVVARRPRMQMLIARNWDMLFGARDRTTLSLAEVVQRHRQVVILGDPGSGKTTLGKWLTVQFARALRAKADRVVVQADRVHPGRKAYQPLDLGPAHLPIFIRIVAYARARFANGEDTGLTLEQFIARGQFDEKILPAGLTPASVGGLASEAVAQGQALLILDGLDEVGNPDQRRQVMHAVREFLRVMTRTGGERQTVLTSRIVGYQFDPLTYLPHYTVEDMDETAIAAFCRAWMAHVAAAANAAEEARRLKGAIFDHAHPGVKVLAGNPLLLTILAQVYWGSADRALPARRVTLFDEATRAIYDQRAAYWDQAGIPPLRLTRALAAVAAHLHAHEVTGFAEEGTVRAQLGQVLSDPEQVDAVLKAARDVSGFLVARGEGVYGFLHRSLQEYFAGQWLAAAPEMAAARVAERALDATWREPIVLALGVISGRRYTDSQRRLPQVFEAVLNAPDPAGEVLPRRELLAAIACAECERVPQATAHHIAENLLTFYADRDGRARTRIMRQRVQRAFEALYRSPAREETEQVLCLAMQDAGFERRYAAVDVIIETRWDTPQVARVLAATWKRYDTPARSLLVALDGLYYRQPAVFEVDYLPMRAALQDDKDLWRRVADSQNWQALFKALYLPLGAEFSSQHINRDSALTPDLVAQLRLGGDLSPEFLAELRRRAVSDETTSGRDAGLALAALNDSSWLGDWRIQAWNQVVRPRGLIPSLDYMSDRDALDLDRDALDRARVRARALARALTLARNARNARVLNLAHDYDLARALDAHDLAYDRGLARDLAHDLDTLARDLAHARARDLTIVRDLALDLALAHDLVTLEEIEQLIRQARARQSDDAKLQASLDSIQSALLNMKRLLTGSTSLARTYAELLQQIAATSKQPTHLVADPAPSDLTSAEIERRIIDLQSADDSVRAQTRLWLEQARTASTVGRGAIERLAVLRQDYRDFRPAGAYLARALHQILHDRSDWLNDWIRRAARAKGAPAEVTILLDIRRITPESLAILLTGLPHTNTCINRAILHSLGWLVRLKRVPDQGAGDLRSVLINWLPQETQAGTRRKIIETLGYWPTAEADIVLTLKSALAHATEPEEQATLWMAFARLTKPPADLANRTAGSPTLAALARWTVTQSTRQPQYVLDKLYQDIPNQSDVLRGLMAAGTDDDTWNDDFHGNLVIAARLHLEAHADELLPTLIQHWRESLASDKGGWPTRRMTLAVIAACAETMPSVLHKHCPHELESLLIKSVADMGSHNSRRFALTAMSYLRAVTPSIVPVFLAGCQDVAVVQQDTIAAAGRFEKIDGDVLPPLIEALTGESLSTAYAVAQVLGALGSSAAGESAGLRDHIIEALVAALKHPNSQREVQVWPEGRDELGSKGKLEDALYAALLQVAGWPA